MTVGVQAQVFQLLADKVRRILVFEGQDYSDRWVLFWGRYWLRVFNFRAGRTLPLNGNILQKNTTNTMISDMHDQSRFSKVLVYIACRHGSGSGAKDRC